MVAAVVLTAGAVSIATAGIAAAATTQKDLQIIGRMVGFFDPPMAGQVPVGIVYDAAGKSEAEALVTQMGTGFVAGSVTLVPRLVPAGDAAASGLKMLLLTGTGANPGLVEAVAGKGILIVSTLPGCADTAGCIVSVQSEPKVEITMNRAAAEATGVKVGSAFRMMIKER
ncbi:MAG TPA: hypothetical protein VED40_00890 [Azospirillaceae bacterium]|nr:hypothetical protein [Azospirillaceae bacterium]